jgi:predicted amidohydrolase
MVKLGAVQPMAHRGDEEYQNVERALAYIDEAAAAGVQIISFPEGYPGPYYGELTYDPDEQIRERARARGMYVVYSRLESPPDDPDCYYCILRLIDSNGDVLGSYRRLQPPPTHVNDVLFGKDLVPGPEEDLVVYETDVGNLGLLICSEVYSPELARVLTLKGADILFYPIGGLIYELTDTWKTMIWARAIENLVYVASTQNLYGWEEGIGMIAGPEQVLAESKRPGMLVADLDLDRLQELRGLDQRLDLPMPYRVIPGLLRWRRPELYGELVKSRDAAGTR